MKRIFSFFVKRQEGFLWLIVAAAFASFEVFNYGTTQYALEDMLGMMGNGNVPWAILLSVAFCGMDFAGVTLLFSSSKKKHLLSVAWILATIINAMLTWWAVSLAVSSHNSTSIIVSREIIIRAVPILIAIMVWLLRILLIGTFSSATATAGQELETFDEDLSLVERKLPELKAKAKKKGPLEFFKFRGFHPQSQP